jgi:protein TonB
MSGDGSMQQQFEPPVTSAPLQAPSAGNVDVNGERTDATALPSDAYSAAAARARAERQVRGTGGPIDPRSITNNNTPVAAPSTRPVRRTLPPQAAGQQGSAQQAQQPIRVAAPPHTEPIPIYQPVPAMRVDRDSVARMYLTVGPDGRVHDIDVIESIPGEMPRLIAAVQNWRFRPALQNGQPVTSTFSVDIRVRAR